MCHPVVYNQGHEPVSNSNKNPLVNSTVNNTAVYTVIRAGRAQLLNRLKRGLPSKGIHI